jgi:hypothetical protein
VRLGARRRGRDRRLHGDVRVVHDGLGLGDDRRLEIGIRLEQVLERRQIVQVDGQGQPCGGIMRLRARGRRADRASDVRGQRTVRANAMRVAR